MVVYNPPVSGASLDTDGTMAANSDTAVPSQAAVITYVAANAPASNDANSVIAAQVWS